MEGVPAAALGERSADGAHRAGDRSGFLRETVPDAAAVEPALVRQRERYFLLLILHGSVRLRPASAGKSGEAEADARGGRQLRLNPPKQTRMLRLKMRIQFPW